MKPILRILCVLCLLFSGNSAKSQVILSIDTIYNWPDTIVEGQTAFPTALVRNGGATPYQGTLQVAFQVTNPMMGAIGYLYFNNNAIFIAPFDTISLTSPTGVTFDSTYFRAGNNVVVVWPVTTQSVAQIDTVYTDVFLLTISGVNTPFAPGLLMAPVPARDYLQVRTVNEFRIEHVRIYDLMGRELPVESQPMESGGREVYLGNIPSGQYIIETLFRNGPPSRSRFIHVH